MPFLAPFVIAVPAIFAVGYVSGRERSKTETALQLAGAAAIAWAGWKFINRG